MIRQWKLESSVRNTPIQLCIVKTAPPTKSKTYAPLEFRAEDGETPPLSARGRSLFAEPACFGQPGSLALSDGVDERRRCPFGPPGARQTPPAVDQMPNQSANGRKSPPLQAPRRADAGQAAQQQPKVAAGRLDEHPLADILMAAYTNPTQTPGFVLVRERPLHQRATPPL